jgi:hypothetical protein
MSSKASEDMQDGNDMVWNNDWDDDDSTGALESQRILPNDDTIIGYEDQEIEDEIQANLSSKITSSLHAYKIAGFALVVALVSFTINTVCCHNGPV